MVTNIVYIATSLDGFIAKSDGNIDWLNEIPNPDKSDFGFNAFMQKIDALIMGRGTFDVASSFKPWPYPKKVFVLSNSIEKVEDELKDKVEIIKTNSKTIPTILEHITKQGYSTFYIDGGKVIQSFLKENLIDELIITRVPIILGDGIPLFGLMNKEIQWKHVDTISYSNGLVKSHYKKK